MQLWGPRFSAYVVAASDLAVFSLGRLPDDGAAGRRRAEDLARRLHAFLGGRTMTYGEAGRGLGVHPNSLRYAAPTGTVLIRWDGARQPTIWTVPPPDVDPATRASSSRAGTCTSSDRRRPRHSLSGPGSRPADGRAAFDALAGSLTPVRTPVGDAWILTGDEPTFRAPGGPAAAARLLPSGDAYFLLQGADRELLVPDPDNRRQLWTPRVWPGAVLVEGEIVGTWRRAAGRRHDRVVAPALARGARGGGGGGCVDAAARHPAEHPGPLGRLRTAAPLGPGSFAMSRIVPLRLWPASPSCGALQVTRRGSVGVERVGGGSRAC